MYITPSSSDDNMKEMVGPGSNLTLFLTEAAILIHISLVSTPVTGPYSLL